jgi:hypothetical protein
MGTNPMALRVLWFIGIWVGSVLALGAVAYVIRFFLSH